jgi:hypothetical protein
MIQVVSARLRLEEKRSRATEAFALYESHIRGDIDVTNAYDVTCHMQKPHRWWRQSLRQRTPRLVQQRPAPKKLFVRKIPFETDTVSATP